MNKLSDLDSEIKEYIDDYKDRNKSNPFFSAKKEPLLHLLECLAIKGDGLKTINT